MPRMGLQVADVFRRHGAGWLDANTRHVSAGQRRVIGALVACRTAKLGGHVERCEDCQHTHISYNSCRNRHCPTCQWSAAQKWLEARKAELLPVPYFHVVFTLPADIAALAYHNKRQLYDLLFKASSEALTVIAADLKHLGTHIGLTSVLHTWGQNLDHHPHIHCIVPGGGISPDGSSWIAFRPNFFLSVRVLSRLFRRLYLKGLARLHAKGKLKYFGALSGLADLDALGDFLAKFRRQDWVVYAKRPFAGPEQVLAYLARYTHRVAISNSRLLATDDGSVRFRWKDYRQGGNCKVMTLTAGEFMRRFLLHVLPNKFHRIRHFGIFANTHRSRNIAECRRLVAAQLIEDVAEARPTPLPSPIPHPSEPFACPCCGGRMIVIETLIAEKPQQQWPKNTLWDTS